MYEYEMMNKKTNEIRFYLVAEVLLMQWKKQE